MIAQEAGVVESTLFRHFGTKDNLLKICFETVDKQIAALFCGMEFPSEQIHSDPESLVFLLWSRYFHWLIAHREETLFYFYYRTDPSFPAFDRSRKAPWFQDFIKIFEAFDAEYHLYEKVRPETLWTQVLTVTQLYAKLVLEGAIPSDDQTVQSIFHTQMDGICRLMEKQPSIISS